MADVRALLKAKRQEARIAHPCAAYGANGALRCTACGVAVKLASAWEGHLGSRAHRAAVAKVNSRLRSTGGELVAASSSSSPSKRKAEEREEEAGRSGDGDGDDDGDGDGDDDEDDEGRMEIEATTTTTTTTTTELGRPGKRQRTAERESETASRPFPADFFSDPARRPPPPPRPPGGSRDEEGEEEDGMDQEDAEIGHGATDASAAAPKSQFEMEWDAFERDVLGPSRRPAATTTTTTTGDGADREAAAAAAAPRETYARATIAAEPELVPRFVGLPEGAAQGRPEDGVDRAAGEEGKAKAPRSEEEEEEGRRRREREERELILDRLVEEERAQEDAYNRVALLRNRVQALKQKRELAKAKGKGGKKADAQT
ncbi:hypothetical protein F5148DRAFT_1214111 [Russula earlei]|uniref:Uncharacterized protein n=1 Tax=Russula earlei TaxID=71964 RepID=A0ACC0U4H1_9AGAM|nr:hypothetical protein F5148DRAFT_1214111 [Russula earlei]